MLTEKQKLTLEHLAPLKITTPDEIIEFCLFKLQQPNKSSYRKRNKRRLNPVSCAGCRNHSKEHYFGIIEEMSKIK